MALFFQDLPDPDGVALDGGEGLTDKGEKLLVGRPPLRCLPRPPDNPLDGIPGYFQDPADLPDVHSPPVKAQYGLPALFRDHRTSLSLFRVP